MWLVTIMYHGGEDPNRVLATAVVRPGKKALESLRSRTDVFVSTASMVAMEAARVSAGYPRMIQPVGYHNGADHIHQ